MTVAELKGQDSGTSVVSRHVVFRHILVATDFSEASRRALCGALTLATDSDTQVSVIHVMTAGLTVACMTRLLPEFASLTFAPLVFRGWFYFIQKPGPLLVRRLGWSELSQAIAFCLLFITASAR